MAGEVILQVKDVSKSFFGVKVLDRVDFDVRSGEVHALMGENGAGKSTLMRIIMGIYKADTGSLLFEGKPVTIREARDALDIGISMIHQELNPIPEMTVAENIFLGREPHIGKLPFVDFRELNRMTQELLEKYEMADRIQPETKMSKLSIAQIQMMEIVKAVSYDAKVIIMDEPTSSLSESETTQLFKTIRLLRDSGVGIIYISHRIAEVFELADRISVLRDGALIDTVPRQEATLDRIVSTMVGRALSGGYPRNETEPGRILLKVDGASGKGFEDVSFQVRAGEILGFAGLVGAGRSELMRALVGYDKLKRGEVFVDGKKVTVRHPSEALKNGIVIASEDRKALGLVLCRDIRENISIQNERLYSRFGFMDHKTENRLCLESAMDMAVKMNSINDTVSNLSGGNQQKVVLARCLRTNPKILILDEPTRGIDVGAKAEIYKKMVELAADGMAIIMISSEMPELIGMSNRILTMSGGKVRPEFDNNKERASQTDILMAALGGVE